MLRETNSFKNNFEPKVVSIGPYHCKNDKLKPAEELKLRFTKEFIRNCRQPMDVSYNKILKKIKQLRDCYEDSEEATKKRDDEELAWMLFKDGCFLLHFIYCLVNGKLKDLNITHHDVAFVRQDLFLLENQLAFLVLEKLMSSRFIDIKEGTKIIEEFIRINIKTPRRLPQSPVIKEKPSHLLQLLREGLIYKPEQTNNPAAPRIIGQIFSRLHNLLPTRLIHKLFKDKRNKEVDWHPFGNVMELTAVGVRLMASEMNCVTDVSFKSHFFYGDLKLPPTLVDDSSKAKFLNLIAYEMSPGVVNDLEVTSYICFLDSPIDDPNDIKVLREKHILYNFLGSDTEVAKLFNEIGNDSVPNDEIYKGVKSGSFP